MTVKLGDFSFSPKDFTIPANTAVKIELRNVGTAPHNFSIDALDISIPIAAGEAGYAIVDAPSGTYGFYSRMAPLWNGLAEPGLVGTLNVVDGAADTMSTVSVNSRVSAAADTASEAVAAVTAGTVTVEMGEMFFEPREVTIPANTPIRFDLTNISDTPHNFSIDALKISIPVPPASTVHVTISAAASTYEYYCRLRGHKEAGMDGTLIVQG